MACFIHPTNTNYLYGSSQYGSLYFSNDGGTNFNWTSGDISESSEWTTPYMLDPGDPSILYAAAGNVWRSSDHGAAWSKISNFPINAALSQPNISSALAVAPSNSNYLYCAKRFYYSYGEPSALWVTTNGGNSWMDRSAGLPDSLYLTYIAVDGDAPQTAWVTASGFSAGAKVFKTMDAGQNWSNISMNLPNLPVNCVVHDLDAPNNPVYIGMDAGVYYTNDTMNSWSLYAADLPNVVVSDLEIHRLGEKLLAATFGRGIWSVDLKDATGTGVNGMALRNAEMSISPNPNGGDFSLELGNLAFQTARLEVVDVMGRVLYGQELRFNSHEFRAKISTGLPAGMYFVRVVKGNLSLSQRMLVQ
ncbi:MAG TPA: T9SS type A sorting domain-containing protein [Bacteroidetes bacterium]|nr:T9SS type A sorting domain-containing protein [Bacteroidota bacterium]